MLAAAGVDGYAGRMTTSENVVEVRDLRKTYGDVAAVDGKGKHRRADVDKYRSEDEL